MPSLLLPKIVTVLGLVAWFSFYRAGFPHGSKLPGLLWRRGCPRDRSFGQLTCPPEAAGSPRSSSLLARIELALSRDYEVQRLLRQPWDCVPSPTVRLYGLAKLHDQAASASYSLSSSCIYKL